MVPYKLFRLRNLPRVSHRILLSLSLTRRSLAVAQPGPFGCILIRKRATVKWNGELDHAERPPRSAHTSESEKSAPDDVIDWLLKHWE